MDKQEKSINRDDDLIDFILDEENDEFDEEDYDNRYRDKL